MTDVYIILRFPEENPDGADYETLFSELTEYDAVADSYDAAIRYCQLTIADEDLDDAFSVENVNDKWTDLTWTCVRIKDIPVYRFCKQEVYSL